jgi:hypothetical protein
VPKVSVVMDIGTKPKDSAPPQDNGYRIYLEQDERTKTIQGFPSDFHIQNFSNSLNGWYKSVASRRRRRRRRCYRRRHCHSRSNIENKKR